MAPSIGLIGYGRFGKLAAKICARETDVYVYRRSARRHSRIARRIHGASLEIAASQPVVILSVPVSELQDVLRAVSPHIRRDAIVIDVCAVKTLPVRWMKSILPSTTTIIGTHPLFGPDSAAQTIAGHRIVLAPVRAKQKLVRQLSHILRKHGLQVISMTPAAHDRMIAETLLVTQFLGRVVGNAKIPQWKNSTRTYERLLSLVAIAERDTQQLLVDMWRYNPHARSVTNALLRAHLRLQNIVAGQGRFR
jgi:prephenate dehydrogenase